MHSIYLVHKSGFEKYQRTISTFFFFFMLTGKKTQSMLKDLNDVICKLFLIFYLASLRGGSCLHKRCSDLCSVKGESSFVP